MQKDLLDLTIRELLDKFGAGSHKPGSGSAAAMLGLVSCKMTQTVIKLTIDRPEYKDARNRLIEIRDEIKNEIEPALKKALNEDSIQFDRVIQARNSRDDEKNYVKKSELEDAAFNELRLATEIPVHIAEKCIQLTKKAIVVFNIGFQSARGDSAVAINSALSGASGAVSIIYLNLVSFWGDRWALKKINQADELNSEINELQSELSNRVKKLKTEVEESNSPFKLDVNEFEVKSSNSSNRLEMIELQVRKLQNLLWENRRNIWKEDTPKNLTDVLRPETVVNLFGFEFEKDVSLGQYSKYGELIEVAGLFDPNNSSVSVSSQFPMEVQKFTAAHELGHLVLHNDRLTLHRDRPLNGGQLKKKTNPIEVEANKFASFFLMPRKEVLRTFIKNFNTDNFKLDQDTAFALGENSVDEVKSKYKSKLELARRLSKETFYSNSPIVSLVEKFNVSVEAMAIRLLELDLITYKESDG